MATPPQLDDQQKRVLREILNHGIIRGSELLRATQLDATDLSAKVQELRNKDLIRVRGNPEDPTEIPYAVFSVRPSDSKFLKHTVS